MASLNNGKNLDFGKISRRGLAGAALALAAGFFSPSVARAKPTAKCVKVGQKIISDGYNYRCVKQRGKLIWRKGKKVKVRLSNPSPSPTATPSPTTTSGSTASPTPSPSPTATSGSTASPSPSPTATSRRAGFFIANSNEVLLGQSKIFFGIDLAGRTVRYSLFRTATGVSAIDVICTHAGCVVTPTAAELICRCHFSYFDAETGKRKSGPADLDLKSYPLTEIDGEIYILS